MKKYTTADAVTFDPGTQLELTAEQAATRAHALEPYKADPKEPRRAIVVKTRAAVQFKAGEIIGYDGAVPKSMAGKLLAVIKPPVEK